MCPREPARMSCSALMGFPLIGGSLMGTSGQQKVRTVSLGPASRMSGYAALTRPTRLRYETVGTGPGRGPTNRLRAAPPASEQPIKYSHRIFRCLSQAPALSSTTNKPPAPAKTLSAFTGRPYPMPSDSASTAHTARVAPSQALTASQQLSDDTPHEPGSHPYQGNTSPCHGYTSTEGFLASTDARLKCNNDRDTPRRCQATP